MSTPAERVQAFLDWWHPQHGDVIGKWVQTEYSSGLVTRTIELLASDLRALLHDHNHP